MKTIRQNIEEDFLLTNKILEYKKLKLSCDKISSLMGLIKTRTKRLYLWRNHTFASKKYVESDFYADFTVRCANKLYVRKIDSKEKLMAVYREDNELNSLHIFTKSNKEEIYKYLGKKNPIPEKPRSLHCPCCKKPW